MSAKKQSVVYRLPKQGYEEVNSEEWSDMAICDAYDNAVQQPDRVKKSLDTKPKYKQMQNYAERMNGEGDRKVSDSKHSQPHNGKSATTRFSKEENSGKDKEFSHRPGDTCVALYHEDGLYYPCTVVSVDKAKKSYTVEFDGYGNHETVDHCDIFTEEQWNLRTNELSRKYNTDDNTRTSASSSAGTSSSTEGTSSDVTQDIYSDSRNKRKRFDSKRGRDCKYHSELPPNFPYPNFGPNPFSGMPPPPPPPCFPVNKAYSDLSDDTLSSMLMSWYMAGYHTGYYQGVKSRGGRKSKKM